MTSHGPTPLTLSALLLAAVGCGGLDLDTGHAAHAAMPSTHAELVRQAKAALEAECGSATCSYSVDLVLTDAAGSQVDLPVQSCDVSRTFSTCLPEDFTLGLPADPPGGDTGYKSTLCTLHDGPDPYWTCTKSQCEMGSCWTIGFCLGEDDPCSPEEW